MNFNRFKETIMREDHPADIDFRNHSARTARAKEDFVSRYNELQGRIVSHGCSDRLSGQITMLSSVLWYLLSPQEYKKLTQYPKGRRTNQPTLLGSEDW